MFSLFFSIFNSLENSFLCVSDRLSYEKVKQSEEDVENVAISLGGFLPGIDFYWEIILLFFLNIYQGLPLILESKASKIALDLFFNFLLQIGMAF